MFNLIEFFFLWREKFFKFIKDSWKTGYFYTVGIPFLLSNRKSALKFDFKPILYQQVFPCTQTWATILCLNFRIQYTMYILIFLSIFSPPPILILHLILLPLPISLFPSSIFFFQMLRIAYVKQMLLFLSYISSPRFSSLLISRHLLSMDLPVVLTYKSKKDL